MTTTKQTVQQIRKSAYERVTSQILCLMEQGTVPWRQPWASAWPMNLSSGNRYRGINAMALAMQGRACAYWVTYKQAKQLGGSVKKGEKGSAVLFFGEAKKDAKEKQPKNEETEGGGYRFAKAYVVFNAAEQCEGLEVPQAEKRTISPLKAADQLVRTYLGEGGPSLVGGGSSACYTPSSDEIQLPARDRFFSTEEYYSTLFHEVGHSTGHRARLNREAVAREGITFGDHLYSEEELVAELTAAFLCAESGIAPAVIENQAAYLKSWASKLNQDPKLFWRASAAAQKATEHILGAEVNGNANRAEIRRLKAEIRMLRISLSNSCARETAKAA